MYWNPYSVLELKKCHAVIIHNATLSFQELHCYSVILPYPFLSFCFLFLSFLLF